ncbi:hypothetical protein ANCCAN_23100, partial [Ancylostoma caninum]
RCCSGGSRHFVQTQTCSNIKAEGTSATCVRTASICCLRALLDSACEEGTTLARQDDMCPSSINTLGGGIRKHELWKWPGMMASMRLLLGAENKWLVLRTTMLG